MSIAVERGATPVSGRCCTQQVDRLPAGPVPGQHNRAARAVERLAELDLTAAGPWRTMRRTVTDEDVIRSK